ncbi:efflux RND transporter permease subunit [Exilibacterium tricleocarpae]|uniref:Efflux RND transporter permease subunit n=1 Tax=Exilibacterium tricleocarpae TaxID=2591008 RepID=A0A545TYW3_9GAMM|nr:efflux RND transporter permease subunit [Exilibacterium tricleocarpae]TQV82410.1 efflux RND transporter permease subunit [Exilibacterium tricleocarpae]
MSRIIQWFVENPIAANLLMVLIITGGVFNLAALDKEVFPAVLTDTIEITLPYPGAGPQEVEEQIAVRIEEAIADLDGIEEIRSESRQGSGRVIVEVISGFDPQRVLNDIKTRVDAISTFPAESERPQITQQPFRRQIMSLALYGDVAESALKRTGERLRDELALLPGVSLVQLNATRPDEMAIEVSEQSLRRYNLSFQQVADAVRGSSLNLPAGTIKTEGGDIQLQTRGQAYTAEDFASIVVASRDDGARLYLGDIAQLVDGFAEQDVVARLNGKPAVYLELFITENPNILTSTATVREYIAGVEAQLPEGLTLTVWRDWSELFTGRMNLLLKNSLTGLLLVFVVLMLFLRPALAGWVCVGIAVAFVGALWILPYTGTSINMISLFAFLLVLGIVVDDAIIVGESIYTRQQHGMLGTAAAASGTKMVSKPVLFAVISTMIFFTPMFFLPGNMGDISLPIPAVVILCLTFSLIESMLILPSHLANLQPEQPSRFKILRSLARVREKFAGGMTRFASDYFRPRLERLLQASTATISCFVVAFALSLAVYASGWIKQAFMPIVPGDFVMAQVVLAEGVPFTDTLAVMHQIDAAAGRLRRDPDMLAANEDADFVANVQTWGYGNRVTVVMALQKADVRVVGTQQVTTRWRELIGDLPEVEDFDLSYTINHRTEAIRLRLSTAGDEEQLAAAVDTVKRALARYPDVYDLKDSLETGRTEIELDLKAHAENLELGLTDIARQVRQGFYGEEVQRIPRGKEDVKVMVRYPREERQQVEQLGDMRIRTNDDREIPLEAVADIRFVPGYTTINRIDRKRSITLSAEVADGPSNGNMIVADLLARNLGQWQRQFPGFTLQIDGDMQDEADFMSTITRSFILTLLIIYGLMAVAFRSYWQPVLILTAIPFGFMGAVIGHLIMGREISMLSILGFIACAGVVVNDNLVLLDRINQLRKQGLEAFKAVAQAAQDRFRPIVLTSITTFVGLVPILSEQSTQARFLIPMVISLSFGVLFATTVTLILVPSLYYTAEKIKARLRRGDRLATET